MKGEELSKEAPGRMVSYGRDAYYKPKPLPPEATLAFDEEFYL
ncbi:hypothetical protein [Halobacterium sp. KA-6]|jgi:hypothetical protein|nr:hypothetical protein [Halobacterium sp. KA-6]